MRYKITIEYDGTGLLGWQKQLDGPSVQDFLEKTIICFNPNLQTKEQQAPNKTNIFEVYGAGRTDAGVHAIAQVAHFDLETNLDCFRIREAMNYHLRIMDAPISVLEVEETDKSFHARYSAKGRGYIYRILNRRAPSVLNKNRVWWVPITLDVNKMRQGAKYLIGKHDFSSFRASSCQAESPIKTIDKIDILQNGEEITFIVEAKSFLHHQVRNIVGTLKIVGDGSIAPEDVKTILEAADRTKAGATAPASGLYLNKVVY